MRTIGIIAAAVIGAFVGMMVGGLLSLPLDSESAQVWGTFLGALIGAVGLGWLVAHLLPTKPSRLRSRGQQTMQETLQGRDQRIVRW